MSNPFDNPFDIGNFPDLYPSNIQDEVNEAYTHDKVLPRVEGQDYTARPVDALEDTIEDSVGMQEQTQIIKPRKY